MPRAFFSLLLLFSAVLLGAGCRAVPPIPPASPSSLATASALTSSLPPSPAQHSPSEKDVDLRTVPGVHPAFAVTLTIPASWEVEAVPAIEAVNLYDPAVPGVSPREQSRVFLRHFRGSDFLTLTTVTIQERTRTTVAGRPAVTYGIEKKPGVAAFPHQPAWRNIRHRVTDVRLQDPSPSEFLVIAQNPVLPDATFESVLSSLRPAGLPSSLVFPVEGFVAAVTKKPFGIRITPETSPVQPERFSGFHTGADAELPADTPVVAVVDGTVLRSERVSGYGGLIAIEHRIAGERIVGIYGHLDPARLPARGARVRVEEQVGILGEGFTAETDGERSHLHFGLYAGAGTSVAGYVASSEALLADWRDPVAFLQSHSAREPE